MKKWMMMIGAGTLAMGLAACGETAEPAAGSEDKKEADSELTLEEVFTKSTEASQQIKSFHADMITNQLMSIESVGMEMEMAMNIGMDMTIEPLAFYQTSETSMVSEEMGDQEPMTMEMYMTEEGMYMNDPTIGSWIKMPEESIPDLQAMMEQQTADPSQQLEDLKAFQDDFTFEQTEDEYILKLDAAGEEFQALIHKQMEQVVGQMELEAQTALEEMKINAVAYELFIDKKTFLPNDMNVDMDIDMNIEGDTMSIKSDVEAAYSKYNEIEAITVPEEVLEQAKEMSF
ncbi:hypothetical protein QWY16_02265 [Planococcus shenhongbingii]|uniref:DUF6612 family protein n=1 Tax=Planococcus shenhongbingii TaxID=3058398 RepID=UPI00260EFF2C|nr:DUF6612 family protein [Planococcus sp. N016]WKA59005.1 hypothetical protein QWY16_02265 [Planococcus sp. N016]